MIINFGLFAISFVIGIQEFRICAQSVGINLMYIPRLNFGTYIGNANIQRGCTKTKLTCKFDAFKMWSDQFTGQVA